MKAFKKISLLLSFVALATVSAFAISTTKVADAADLKGNATGYTKASDVVYQKSGKYVKNWGARDEACTFLTSYANDFYTGSYTFDQLSTQAGGTSQSNAYQSVLYSSLKQLMSSKQTYQTSYNATRDLFCYTDCVNSNSNYISSFYSAKQISGTWDGGSTWNREHTWPNSKGDGNGNGENDIIMLRPTSVSENSSRGNKAYGESSSYYDPNGLGQNVRGDCARTMLYVYTRWANEDSAKNYMWGTSGVIENLNVLLKWMQEDPVDTWEMGRNDAVQAITGTRNVFVDYPEYAWMLFGKEIPSNMSTPSGIASGGTYVPPAGGSGSGSGEDITPEDPASPEQILNDLYALSSGSSLQGSFTLTGVITALDNYNNPTIVVGNMTDKPVYCYKLKDDRFVVGATITVTATTMKNYEGTYEFMNCTLDSIVLPGESTNPESSEIPESSEAPESSEVVESTSITLTAGALGVGNEVYAKEETTATLNGVTFGFLQIGNYPDGLIRFRTKDGVHGSLWNTTALSGKITKIVFTHNPDKKTYDGNEYEVAFGTTAACTDKVVKVSTSASSNVMTVEVDGEYTFFKITHMNTYTQYWNSVEVFFEGVEGEAPESSEEPEVSIPESSEEPEVSVPETSEMPESSEVVESTSITLTAGALGVGNEVYAKEETTATLNGVTFGFLQIGNYPDGLIRFRTKDGVHGSLWNTTALSGKITKIVFTHNPDKKTYDGNEYEVAFGTTAACTDKVVKVSTSASSNVMTVEVDGEYTFFKITHMNTYTQYWNSVEVFFEGVEGEAPESSEEPEVSIPESSEEPEVSIPESSEEPEVSIPESSEEPEVSIPESSETPEVSESIETIEPEKSESSEEIEGSEAPEKSEPEVSVPESSEEPEVSESMETVEPEKSESSKEIIESNEEIQSSEEKVSSETTSVPATSEETSSQPKEETSGCGSSVGASMAALVFAAGACLLMKKSKKEE